MKTHKTDTHQTYLLAMEAPSAPWVVITGGGSGIGRGSSDGIVLGIGAMGPVKFVALKGDYPLVI